MTKNKENIRKKGTNIFNNINILMFSIDFYGLLILNCVHKYEQVFFCLLYKLNQINSVLVQTTNLILTMK
jgi:hypothetical protein